MSIMHIQLHHLRPRPLPLIANLQTHFEGLCLVGSRGRPDLQIAIPKIRVRQPIPKRKLRRDAVFVEIAIPHINSFRIFHLQIFSRIISVSRRLLQLIHIAKRQFPRGIYVAEQDIRHRVADFLPPEPRIHQRRHVIHPAAHIHRRPRVKNDHGVVIRLHHRRDQFVLPRRQVQRLAIETLRFHARVVADD